MLHAKYDDMKANRELDRRLEELYQCWETRSTHRPMYDPTSRSVISPQGSGIPCKGFTHLSDSLSGTGPTSPCGTNGANGTSRRWVPTLSAETSSHSVGTGQLRYKSTFRTTLQHRPPFSPGRFYPIEVIIDPNLGYSSTLSTGSIENPTVLKPSWTTYQSFITAGASSVSTTSPCTRGSTEPSASVPLNPYDPRGHIEATLWRAAQQQISCGMIGGPSTNSPVHQQCGWSKRIQNISEVLSDTRQTRHLTTGFRREANSGFGSQVPIRTVGSSNTTGTDLWKNNRISSTPGFQCPGPSFPLLRSTTEHPLLSPPGYSAHRERIKQEAEESRKNYQPLAPLTSSQDNLQSSYLHQLRRRQHHSSLSAIQPGCIGLKEVESVTIQPIGRGVHDLSSRKGSTSTLRQSRRPMASSMLEGLNGVDQCGFAQQNRKDMFVSNARRTSLIDISRSVPARTERAASTSYLSSLRGQSIEDVNVTGGYHRSTKQQVTTSPPIPLRHSLHHLLQQKTPTRILASQAPTSAVQETPLTVAQKPGKELQRPVDWSSPQRNSKASPTVECTPYSPSLVEATMPSWYRLKLSRQEAIRILQQQPPGSFLVRSSTTYKDAYGLAVRSPRPLSKANRKSDETNAGCVRHYLIETVTNPIAGVKIKGFSAEQAFANIFELIHHHTQFPVALPCRLVLPVGTPSQQVSSDVVSDADEIGGNPEPLVQPPLIPQSSTRSGPPRLASSAAGALRSTPASSPPSITCRCLYLGAVNVDATTGDAALAQAVDILIPGPVLQAVACDQLGATSPVQYTEGMLYVAHDQGILLTDISQKLFSHVHFSVDSFVYAGVDLREKAFIHPNHSALGLLKPRLFGFIVRNWNEGHVVHVLSEFDAINSATDVTAHINSLILCR